MSRASRQIAVLVAMVTVALGLAGCGDSGEILAQVPGGGSLSKATLEHWIPIEAVTLNEFMPKGPPPKGVVPDPPNYTACVSFLSSPGQRIGLGGTTPTTAQLKSKCAQKARELKVITLNVLILWHWLMGEGATQGMMVSSAEVTHRYLEVNKRMFPKRGELANYLKWTGQTVADMLLRARVQLLELKIRQRQIETLQLVPKRLTAQQREAAAGKLIEELGLEPGKYWADRTTCKPGYIVSSCKEYKGPQGPGLPN
jgi:foldase protein PrsA